MMKTYIISYIYRDGMMRAWRLAIYGRIYFADYVFTFL